MNKIRRLLNKREYQGFYAWLVFFVVIGGITGLIIFISNNSNSSYSSDSTTLPTPTVSTEQPQVVINNAPNLFQDRSLGNGTVLKDNTAYLQGDGTLTLDNNGTSDAAIKIITANTGVLVSYIYISANNSSTINNISDGNYKILFESGNDWDGQEFLQNQDYESFDDSLEYTTTKYSDAEYDHTRYTTYQLTLSAVVDGNAQTSSNNQSIFDQYK
jgi:hypothetical protein